ncbi:hypothetical protein BC833DRAFT_658414 [Globomyces pollinis-pini]|nr:hypothetical protein BC833DRAFT_658414 [Globomyces pollinis-pini]
MNPSPLYLSSTVLASTSIASTPAAMHPVYNSVAKPQANLEELPSELLDMITGYLSITDYAKLPRLSKKFSMSNFSAHQLMELYENKRIFTKPELFKRLLKVQSFDPSANGNYAIRYAVRNGQKETVELLLNDTRVDPSDTNLRALIEIPPLRGKLIKVHSESYAKSIHSYAKCFNQNRLPFAKLLKVQSFDPSANGNYAIRYATRNGQKEIVELLLKDTTVDPSDDDNYAITYAAKSGHFI